jgi:hypothetical protein
MYIKKFNESKAEYFIQLCNGFSVDDLVDLNNKIETLIQQKSGKNIEKITPIQEPIVDFENQAKEYARSRALPGNQLYKSAYHHAKCFLEWQKKNIK